MRKTDSLLNYTFGHCPPAILWNADENLREEIKAGDTVGLVYSVSRNLYRGVETPQLVIKEIARNASWFSAAS
jgi:single-stranded-DNA-specific exonuclease